MSKEIRTGLDFNCSDSFRLSWNKQHNATAYRIYTLTNSPYLEPILTVTDTFAVFQKNLNPSQVYAVQPILNHGPEAARSAAIDRELMGVKCFYRTIYHTLFDNNRININLELSTTAYIDSVYFENVSASGQTIKTYVGLKVIEGKLVYQYLTDEVPPGITYFRGKIKLKNNAIVFTETVSVLTSGERKIWFFPNPAQRTNPVKYVLRQGIPASSSLGLYDVNGRLLQSFIELPIQLNVSKFAPGLIFYKLFDRDGYVLETGKFLVQ
jgi:hypothetical protein